MYFYLIIKYRGNVIKILKNIYKKNYELVNFKI